MPGTTALSAALSHCLFSQVTPVPPVLLPPLASTDELAAEQSWVSGIVRVWLDEEWTPLEVHQDLGRAAGQVGRLVTVSRPGSRLPCWHAVPVAFPVWRPTCSPLPSTPLKLCLQSMDIGTGQELGWLGTHSQSQCVRPGHPAKIEVPPPFK